MGRSGELNFRARLPDDEAGLLALFNEESFLYAATARAPFRTAEEMRLWLDGVVAAQRFEIVAASHDEILGFAGLYIMDEGQSHMGWIMLGVREADRDRGIGSILMKLLIGTAWSLAGLRRVQLTVFCDNEAALRLYRKFGFEIEGRHRWFARRGDEFVDAFTMARVFEGTAADPDADMLQRVRLLRAEWSSEGDGRWIAA